MRKNVSIRSNGIALSPRCLKNDRIPGACCVTSERNRDSIFCVVRIPSKKENLQMISNAGITKIQIIVIETVELAARINRDGKVTPNGASRSV